MKEKALEGLGLLFVAHPVALLQPAAIAAMQQALQPSAPVALKLKVLTNLLELLKVNMLGSIGNFELVHVQSDVWVARSVG